MNLKSLVRGISGIIPGGISYLDFAIVAQTDNVSAKTILQTLVANKIGAKNGGQIHFTKGDKLKAAMFAIEKGAPIEEVSQSIDWKDFEGLVAEILESKDFAVIKNLVLTKPRREIDVVGENHQIALLIDCKHWKRQSPSSLQNIVKKQVERVRQYVAQNQGTNAVPAIVTLYEEEMRFINKVPIIPILKFDSFVDEFYGNLGEIKTIKTS